MESDDTSKISSLLEKILDVNYIFNFSSNEDKAKFKKMLGRIFKNIYFSEYSPDPFKDNIKKIYHEIFKEYIEEKSNRITVIEKNARRIIKRRR